MKPSKFIVALVAFAAGLGVATIIPALAQQGESAEAVWEMTVTRPAGNAGNVTFVKHNRVTGQTLVLSCVTNSCTKTLTWWELQEAIPD